MFIYVCCMYYMYVYIYVSVQMLGDAYIHMHIHGCVYVCIHTQAGMHTYIHTNIHTTCVSTHVGTGCPQFYSVLPKCDVDIASLVNHDVEGLCTQRLLASNVRLHAVGP